MNRLISILLLLASLCNAADFPVHTSTATVDVSKVYGDWKSFTWTWIASNSQSVAFVIVDGTNSVDMTGQTCGFKIGRYTSTGLVTYINETNAAISYTNRVATSIQYTNAPVTGDNYAELFLWSDTPTNTRTIAQGKITVVRSLF